LNNILNSLFTICKYTLLPFAGQIKDIKKQLQKKNPAAKGLQG